MQCSNSYKMALKAKNTYYRQFITTNLMASHANRRLFFTAARQARPAQLVDMTGRRSFFKSANLSSEFRQSASYPYAQDVGPHETDKLLLLQKNFERDPQNSVAAWEYFRELNRQGKFLTVIRLYETDELQLLDKRNGEYREKIRE